jgi:hypothetical protein
MLTRVRSWMALLGVLFACGGNSSTANTSRDGGSTDGRPIPSSDGANHGGDAAADSTHPTDSSTPHDARGEIPAACGNCLEAMCPAYSMCVPVPACSAILQCLEDCVGDAGANCAIDCIDNGAVSAQGFAADVIQCADEACASPCASSLGSLGNG